MIYNILSDPEYVGQDDPIIRITEKIYKALNK